MKKGRKFKPNTIEKKLYVIRNTREIIMNKKNILILLLFFAGIILGAGIQQYFGQKLPEEEKIYKIGVLQTTSELDVAVDGFQKKMAELGYEEGKNIIYSYRNVEGNMARLGEILDEFIRKKKVDMIYALTTPAALAAKEATRGTSIPVVFNPVTDPVKSGLAASLENSGNNLTGVKSGAYPAKRLELLKEFNPGFKIIGVLYREGDPSSAIEIAEMQKIAPEMGVELKLKAVPLITELPEAAKILAGEVEALYGGNDAMISSGLDFLISEARKNKIPLMSPTIIGVRKGALISTGPNFQELGEIAGELAAKIFQGSRPQDLPIRTPPRLWIAVNLKTAGEINVAVPKSILDRADFIVE